jgi:hypothetical protein
MGDKPILHKETITHYAGLSPIGFGGASKDSLKLLVTDQSSLYFAYDNTLYKLNQEKESLFRRIIKEGRSFGYHAYIAKMNKPVDIEEVNLREEYIDADEDQFFREMANGNFDTVLDGLTVPLHGLFKESVTDCSDPLLFKESRRESDNGDYSPYHTLLEILTNM